MQANDLSGMLRAVRRLRMGSLRPDMAPEILQPYLGRGLGQICDQLASAIDVHVSNRRAADAAIRFFGLGRLPEPLAAIASSLRAADGRLGLSTRQVENLIRPVVQLMARRWDSLPIRPSDARPAALCDPFPTTSPSRQTRLRQVLLWAWADVPAAPGWTGQALLFYEQEHLLRRDHLVAPSNRVERQRWRRLAWSVMDVAAYRFAEAVPEDPIVDRAIGPRSLAVIDTLDADALGALELLYLHPGVGDVSRALDVVRAATRSGRPEAPELLGMLRDAITRMRSVPPEVRSKTLALATIQARERRDPAVLPVGLAALDHADSFLAAPYEHTDTIGRRPAALLVVASDLLRTTQELAELFDSFGMYPSAWRMLRRMRAALDTYGDPEQDEEPNGWHQQWLLTTASVDRHLARLSRRTEDWLAAAERTAGKSADLVFQSGVLPAPWGMAARNQLLGTTIDRIDAAQGSGDTAAASRYVRQSRRQLEEMRTDWAAVTATDVRSTLEARLATQRAAWRLALLVGDHDEVREAHDDAWSLVGSWTLPSELERLEQLDRVSARLGVAIDEQPPAAAIARELTQDRGSLRRTATTSQVRMGPGSSALS